ncbi:hypothetical protein DFQ28_008988 [Apophysomyces sp. BC1034]|nr:hypothetical protein DFQ28_008988 [Apophysomyces sp. BC1034]
MAVKLFRLEGSIHILSGYEDGSVSLWECEAGMASFRPVWTSKEHREPILDLAIDDEHLSAISTSADDQIIKYSLSSGDIVKKIKTKKSSLTAVDIRQDNKIMATAGFDHRSINFGKDLAYDNKNNVDCSCMNHISQHLLL